MADSNAPSTPRCDPANGSHSAVAGVCLMLVALVLAVFGQCVTFDFVNYDDRIFVTKNSHVMLGLSWENVLWALTAGFGHDDMDIDYWRPLSMLSHMLDVQLFGLHASGHHAMSVGLHALATVALLLVLRAMTGSLWRSAFAAAVFAIHPLHVESVAWVAERKDVLSGLFFILALGAYTRFARRPFHWGNYLLVTLLFALGLMSKPMLVTLPCLLLLLDWWPLNRIRTVQWWRLVWEKLPLLAMSAAVGMLTAHGPGGSADAMMSAFPLPWRAANAADSCLAYLAQTIWPTGLACFYPHPGKALSMGSVAFAAAGIVAITTGTLLWWRRRYLAVGWFWFIGMLLPVCGLLQSGLQARADRYLYVPMIGLTIMVAWAAADWAGLRRLRRQAAGTLAVAIILALTVAAHRQTTRWRDSEALWTQTLAVTHANANAHNYFGLALKEQERTAEAIAQYQQALGIRPDYAEAHANLGAVLFPAGQREEAITHMRKAVEFDPKVAAFHYNLGTALLQTGQIEPAADSLEKALELDPKHGDATNNLAFIRYQQGRRDEALAHYRRVTDIHPHAAEARRNLGFALLGAGHADEAIRQYEKSVALEPDNPGGLSSFAWVLATCPDDTVRNGPRAVELASRANQLTGSNQPMMLRTLAAAQAEAGQFEQALTTTDRALDLALALHDERQINAIRQTRPFYLEQRPVRDASLKTAP
ncbi:MAG: tetratricopeptide repeat protein [Roseimicrobium sp.]